MNVLAHLHLATLAKSSLIGNVAADFIKGDPYPQFCQIIANGIMMHRRLDAKIDTLAEVKQAKQLFIQSHQRVALITLDVVWDHFLARHWSEFVSHISLHEFNLVTELVIRQDLGKMPDEFQRFMGYLWREKWLENYADLDFIQNVLIRMSVRRPKLFLIGESFINVKNNYQELESLFRQFYPHLMRLANQQVL